MKLKRIKELHPNEKAVYIYIDKSDSFPVLIKKISLDLHIHKCNLTPIIIKLANMGLIDVLDMGTHKEIFKRGYLTDDSN